MSPKPITRLDARPDDAERMAQAQRVIDEKYEKHLKQFEKTKIADKNPERIIERKKMEKAEDDLYEAQRQIDFRKDREEDKHKFITKPVGPFSYYERVKISNPAKCGGCGDHEKYRNKIVTIESQDSCKCIHKFGGRSNGNFCYWGKVDGEKERHHFESLELEKIDNKKYCIQCLSDRGPLPSFDGLCECESLNKV